MTFNHDITAGTVLVIEAIESQNFAAGSAGWKIAANGDAEFNDVTVRGELIAGSGDDYVRITPTPTPAIEFSTSNPDQVAPGSISYDTAGGDSLYITGPNLGAGADFLEFTASPTLNEVHFEYNDTFAIQNPGLEVRLEATQSRLFYEAVNGHRFTGDVYFDGVDRGRGQKSYVSSVASTALAAVETIGVTSDNVDFEVGRAYRVTLHYQGSGNTAGDEVGFRIRRTNLAGTSLFDSLRTHQLNAVNAIVTGESSQIVVNNTGALLSTVVVGSVYRAAGAGTVQMFANASNPVWILVEDIGSASDYPGAKSL